MGDIAAACSFSSTEFVMGVNEIPADRDSSVELLEDGDVSSSGSSTQEHSINDMSSNGFSSSDLSSDDRQPGASKDLWISIIEYLAKFEEELAPLDVVFEMAPDLPDYLGESVNEMVAFRCLEYLFNPSNVQADDNSSTLEPRIEFDLSESCEYVLQCILDETSLSDMTPGGPELSKWNVLPFITHKRDCLPECALEELYNARAEGTENDDENDQERMDVDDDENDQERMDVDNDENRPQTVEVTGRYGVQRAMQEDNSIHGNEDGILGDGWRKGNSSCPGMSSNLVGNDGGNQDDENLVTDVEKLKLDAAHANLPGERISVSSEHTELREDDTTEVEGPDIVDQNEKINAAPMETHPSSTLANLNICIKCKKDGAMLVCNGEGCLTAVHENCLSHLFDYDDMGNLYCRHCTYTHAISEYLESNKELAAAKKRLASFLNFMSMSLEQKELREGAGGQEPSRDAEVSDLESLGTQ